MKKNTSKQTDKGALNEVFEELTTAKKIKDPFNSPHEGYAVILEELEELWEEVRKRRSKRSKIRMRAEAKQVAAMAIRFMTDLT